MINMKNLAVIAILLQIGFISKAQTRVLKLDEAIQAGIQNNKQLKLSQYKINQALSQLEQAKDRALPSVKVSGGYSHALMLSRNFALPSADGQAPKMMKLPFDNTLYMVTGGVKEPIFAGNQFRYARESANLLVQASRLDAEKDKDEVVNSIISAYINYYKIQQNQKVVAQNLEDIKGKLSEINKFESQGLATRNDVLRYQLQQSNTELMALDLENNRKIANYTLNVMLGFPDSTNLQAEAVSYKLDLNGSVDRYVEQALKDRKEFASFQLQERLADVNMKKIHDEKLPTVALTGDLYYINPTQKLIPKSGAYLAPFVAGVNVSWDISTLYKNKNRLNEANIQKQEVAAGRDVVADQVKTQVNQAFMQYRQALEKIRILQTSIEQATENERIMESKYKNSLATTTDRIDAQTLLYQSRINLELAKADATAAYYSLLNATGHIQQ